MRDLESPRAEDGTYRHLWDDFKDGFTVGSPTAKWFYFGSGSFTGDDGVVSTGSHGLNVVAPGENRTTGEPAFTLSVAPDSQNGGLPGGLDHVKWLAYANHTASSGYPGFDAVPGQVFSFETWLGGRTYGTRFQPFGGAVDDPDDDLRLASFAANQIDFETYIVFDFFLTNKTIYAFYERLPFGRGPALGDNYAAFSFQIPVAANNPRAMHHLRISYDRAAGVVRWYVNEEEVFRVDRIGCRIDRRYLTLDHGGEEVLVEPRQLACGMGMFTLLDGYRPAGIGLVKLGDGPTGYFDPDVGDPTPSPFVDPSSLPSSRLFGQGARLEVRRVVVSSAVGT
ncbi:DUF6081 family protein [Actinopolymorpha rutila]|uniref:Uncharacterized protein n=1 Tax=Actinopolymorpha rutila TaxID=446787 RepID=A0A852Z3G6_9ACTN|nr:DUF6081 family protein [Actinopolymorpha rutila]NYH87927.1 hypothetical protein [Actinopolymorpha rutila]